MLCVHGSPSCYSSLHQCHPPAPWSPTGPSRTRSIRMPACLRKLLHRPGRLRLGGRGGAERRRYLAEGQRGGATTRRAAGAVPPAPRCLPRAARRGGGLFAHAEACGFGHRSRHRTPISGSIKVRVLTRAKGRCECCEAGCGFCALEASGRVLLENELALYIADAYPVTTEQCLVIPRRHGADGLALHQPEWNAVVELPHPIVHKRTSTC